MFDAVARWSTLCWISLWSWSEDWRYQFLWR